MEIELLQIEVEFLLLKYGETSVLKALSAAIASNEEDLRGKICALRGKINALKEKKAQTTKNTRAKKQPLDVAKEIIAGSTNEDQLLSLAILYQNRQFLPQLKDVKRFLGRFNVFKNVKSRNDATRAVFESLSRCSQEELMSFTADTNTGGQSSFSKLAEHIMGDRGNKSYSN